MPIQELVELEQSVRRIDKVSRVICALCNVAVAVAVIGWVSLCALSVYNSFVEGFENLAGLSYSIVVVTALFGWIVIFLRCITKIFSCTICGDAPFSKKQVHRVRILALLMLVFALLEFALSAGAAVLYHQSGIHVFLLQASPMDGPLVKINGGALFTSALLYSISVYIEHGALLQRLSDETG